MIKRGEKASPVLIIRATSMRFRGVKLATIRLERAVSELRWRLDKVGCPILLDRVGLRQPLLNFNNNS